MLVRKLASVPGTPVRYWFDSELGEIFGVAERPSASNADALYDQIRDRLSEPSFRPQALLDRFGIEILATTDDPADDLAAHEALGQDASVRTRVVPTFRPDRYLEPLRSGWVAAVKQLGATANTDIGDYAGYVEALEDRRQVLPVPRCDLIGPQPPRRDRRAAEPREAQRIYTLAMKGAVTAQEATAFRRHMVLEMARMSCEDGLVMTLHPGVWRNHHPETYARYGADTGHDIPVTVEFHQGAPAAVGALRNHPNLHLVLFTVDADVFQPRDRTTCRLLPVGIRGRTLVVLGQPLRNTLVSSDRSPKSLA